MTDTDKMCSVYGSDSTNKRWLFVMNERCGRKYWELKLCGEKDVSDFCLMDPLMRGDREHYKRLQETPDEAEVSHTRFGYMAKMVTEDCPPDFHISADTAYDIVGHMRKTNMLNAIARSGSIYVNKGGGFRVAHSDEPPARQYIWKKDLTFPHFRNNEIRIERFADGRHYYAFVGESQVKDGNTVKWNTWEEAYKHAKEYIGEGK